MKRSILKINIIVALILASLSLSAQDITMYHMHNMQQKHQLNPALWGDCRVYVGLPALSSVQVGFENRGFEFIDIVNNFSDFSGFLLDDNTMSFDVGTSLLGFGFTAGKSRISFDLSQKNSFAFSLPRDFLLLARHGNAHFIGETANLNNINIDAVSYTELALGYSREITDKLSVGVRAKLLNGLANLSVENWQAGLTTAPATYALDINSDITMNVSAPLELQYDAEGNIVSDSIGIMDLEPGDLASRYLLNNPNRGFGFDFGAIYKVNDKITVSASVTDFMSSINWSEDVYNFNSEGAFHFEGVSLNPFLSDDFEEEDFEMLTDSIMDIFQVTNSNLGYTTKLATSYYLAGSYDLLTWLNVGGLIHGRVKNDTHYASYTLSTNAKAGKYVSGSLSYTMLGSGDFNLGVGLGFKLGPLQLYMVADNITGIYYDPVQSIPWPGKTQNLDFRFGINMLFGCKEKTDKPKE